MTGGPDLQHGLHRRPSALAPAPERGALASSVGAGQRALFGPWLRHAP
ncbi:hypothetical protein [Azospirillum melinis]